MWLSNYMDTTSEELSEAALISSPTSEGMKTIHTVNEVTGPD